MILAEEKEKDEEKKNGRGHFKKGLVGRQEREEAAGRCGPKENPREEALRERNMKEPKKEAEDVEDVVKTT